ncbi:MAG: 4Fe-4S binding protein [Candidatus Bathyarchaeota archaeon]|nr:MAG: 4Fe-4S binding protein [Candidatus Bathyarchaeota archaeon]
MTPKQKTWKEVPIGGVCWRPSTDYPTGDWRTLKPIRNPEKCNRCLLCFIFCPDAAITWDSEAEDIGFAYDYCKGCGICAHECPKDAIEMISE